MTEFVKIGQMILGLILGNTGLGQKTLELSAEIVNQLRKLLILTLSAIASMILFCLGVSSLLERILNKIDQGESIASPSIYIISIFLVVCLFAFLFLLSKKMWVENELKNEKRNRSDSSILGPNVENAISILIMDFVKEREEVRRAKSPMSVEDPNHHN